MSVRRRRIAVRLEDAAEVSGMPRAQQACEYKRMCAIGDGTIDRFRVDAMLRPTGHLP